MNASPKIYHIVHIDRLPSIIADGVLWCDAEMEKKEPVGTTIGIPKLKRQRRQNPIKCHNSQLTVGECVPFYFCPRSVMLYLIYCQNNDELVYRGGQEPIIHLEADMMKTVAWAKKTTRDGRSPSKTQLPTILKTAMTSNGFKNLIGRQSTQRFGRIALRKNKQSFYWNAVSLGS